MRVLIGCECSGVVRRAFRELGHDALSCDLQPADDRSEFHLHMDVFEAIEKHGPWDMAGFHPPCDFLTVSGNRWFSDKVVSKNPDVLTGLARRNSRNESVAFVKRLWDCGIERIYIENPIGSLSSMWRKPDQTVQPFHFGDPHRKATCLWLNNLPKLVPTSDLTDGEQTCWKMPPSKNRKKMRSETYPGIGGAMAKQWSNL